MFVGSPCSLPPNNLVVASLDTSTKSQLEKEFTSADKAKKNTEQAQHLNRHRRRHSLLHQSIQPQATSPFVLPGVQRRTMPAVRDPTAQHHLGVSLPPLPSSNTQTLSRSESHSSRVSVPLPSPPLNTTRDTDHEDHSLQAPLLESLPPLSTSYVSTNDQLCPTELHSTVHSRLEELHLALQQTRRELKHLYLLLGRDRRIQRKERVFHGHKKK